MLKLAQVFSKTCHIISKRCKKAKGWKTEQATGNEAGENIDEEDIKCAAIEYIISTLQKVFMEWVSHESCCKRCHLKFPPYGCLYLICWSLSPMCIWNKLKIIITFWLIIPHLWTFSKYIFKYLNEKFC